MIYKNKIVQPLSPTPPTPVPALCDVVTTFAATIAFGGALVWEIHHPLLVVLCRCGCPRDTYGPTREGDGFMRADKEEREKKTIKR